MQGMDSRRDGQGTVGPVGAGPCGWPDVRRGRLDNGLTVLTSALPHLRAAAVTVFVRVGSRFEAPEESGLSHLLEHVLFRGCEGYPSAYAFNAAIERWATALGGATARDYSAFDATCWPDAVGDVLDLVGRMMGRNLLQDVDLERQVIVEELQDEIDETGRDVDVDNVAKMALFAGSSFGQKIGGRIELVKRFTDADCRRWYERHYAARNLVLAVAGPVDHDRVMAQAAAAFGALPAGEAREVGPLSVRSDLPALESVIQRGSQTNLQLAWVLPSEHHEDFPALQLGHRLLDDGTCSRLRRRIVDEEGLAYHLGSDLETYHGVSLLTVEASVSHDKVIQVVDAVVEIVGDLGRLEASAEEWERIRRRFAFDWETTVDSASAMAYWMGLQHVYMPDESATERFERVMRLSPEDVRAACARLVRPERLQVTVVGDLEPTARAMLRRRIHRLRGRPPGTSAAS